MTPSRDFMFPEALALHTMLMKLGVDAEHLFYEVRRSPVTDHECISVVVRQPGAGETSFAMDEIDLVKLKDKDWRAEFAADATAWNETSQEFREEHMNKSKIRSRAVEVVAVLFLQGVKLRGQP